VSRPNRDAVDVRLHLKACGKIGLASQKAATTYRLDADPSARNAASVAPDLLLDSPNPVLFDEGQVVHPLWDQVRRATDDRAPAKGLYILTGSATPSENVNRHSGAGRIAIIQMQPCRSWNQVTPQGRRR
jgi:hypothetical protein